MNNTTDAERTYFTSGLNNVSNPLRSALTDTACYSTILAFDDDPFFKLELNPATSLKADFALYRNRKAGRR